MALDCVALYCIVLHYDVLSCLALYWIALYCPCPLPSLCSALSTARLRPRPPARGGADPWTYKGKTRARNACEYLDTTERLGHAFDGVTFPFVVFHSEDDTQVDIAGSKKLFAKAKVWVGGWVVGGEWLGVVGGGLGWVWVMDG